jgi:hypothetical protein
MKGNNRFGSRGCVKCDECRRRKTRCEFDQSRPEQPCRDCSRRGTDCGKTLPAQTNPRSLSDYNSSSSPSPSETSSAQFSPSAREVGGEVKVESSLDNAPVSLLLENATLYATELQRRYPFWSKDRILATIRDAIEHGDFGDLRILLQSPSGKSPINSPILVQSKPAQPMAADYPAKYMSRSHYPGPEMPQVPTQAGTVNPATLTFDESFNYTDALNGDESPHTSFASDAMHSADFEEHSGPYYDMQSPYVLYNAQMRYGAEQHDMGYHMYR